MSRLRPRMSAAICNPFAWCAHIRCACWVPSCRSRRPGAEAEAQRLGARHEIGKEQGETIMRKWTIAAAAAALTLGAAGAASAQMGVGTTASGNHICLWTYNIDHT